jgi:hypothetical protein
MKTIIKQVLFLIVFGISILFILNYIYKWAHINPYITDEHVVNCADCGEAYHIDSHVWVYKGRIRQKTMKIETWRAINIPFEQIDSTLKAHKLMAVKIKTKYKHCYDKLK